ncbi:hypothetical protein D9757_015100 [Collybiopsis confluens]|uniref:Fatty acid desaturase domain-containing protein n=1 Tax=Collybiopsis confluens TaxID=2823264 RepID=A0A8H5CBV4_9AGAR|nr:hypothetical protein D9757_015100 [Collybiopsis confluens]
MPFLLVFSSVTPLEVSDTLLAIWFMATAVWTAATYIDPYFGKAEVIEKFSPIGAEVARWAAWSVYWWFQGLIFTGIWVIGHECGHGAFSENQWVNDIIGFVTHTPLWTPFFSWRISHHRHHSNHASMERDEVYVPKTRSDLGIAPEKEEFEALNWDELFGDTPIYTLYMLLRQQFLAFPAYLLWNVSGQKHYPKWTNHFDPNSILFTKSQRGIVMISNAGIAFMIWAVWKSCQVFGAADTLQVLRLPVAPVIMITYLHHTDPIMPHYRGKEWNFQRGAAATVDRPFLGWQGRFFLHDVAHFHVIHHFFPKMPFYHGPEGTEYLKAFIGEHYNYSEAPVFKALWDNYNECQFVEDDGDVIFYRNKEGKAIRRPTDPYYLGKPPKKEKVQ